MSKQQNGKAILSRAQGCLLGQCAVLNCRPSKDNPDAVHPRPECFWAVDALELAEQLITV